MDNVLTLEEFKTALNKGLLPVRYWDDPILSTVCSPLAVEEFGENLAGFSEALIKTMTSTDTGIGLAANQVGLGKRVIAVKFREEGRAPFVMINPTILRFSDETEPFREGCLSVPTIYDQVIRPKAITVKFQQVDGAEEQYDLEGIDARVVQHEVDHLDGLMFFDRMPKNPRKHVLRQWEKIRHKYE